MTAAEGDLDRAPSRRIPDWATPVLAWSATLWVVGSIQQFAGGRWGISGTWSPRSLFHLHLLSDTGRIRFDADRYLEIAESGYRYGHGYEAVFPGYSLLVRALHGPLGSYERAGVAVTLASGLVAVCLFWHWMGRKGLPRAQRNLGLALFLLYPYGFMLFGVPYSDGLLVALVLGALVLAEHDRPWLAALVGAAATFTRPNSLPLVAALLVMSLESTGTLTLAAGQPVWRMRLDRTRLRGRHLSAAVALLGVGAFAIWMRDRTGDALYFWSVQESWGHRPITDPFNWLKANLVRNGNIFLEPLDHLNEAITFGIIVAAVVALPRLGRRFGWAYPVLTLGLLVTTWVQAPVFAPSGRYLLPAIPFLIALASGWLMKHRVVAAAVLVGICGVVGHAHDGIRRHQPQVDQPSRLVNPVGATSVEPGDLGGRALGGSDGPGGPPEVEQAHEVVIVGHLGERPDAVEQDIGDGGPVVAEAERGGPEQQVLHRGSHRIAILAGAYRIGVDGHPHQQDHRAAGVLGAELGHLLGRQPGPLGRIGQGRPEAHPGIPGDHGESPGPGALVVGRPGGQRDQVLEEIGRDLVVGIHEQAGPAGADDLIDHGRDVGEGGVGIAHPTSVPGASP